MGKKYTYEEVKKIVNNLGYELISEEYKNNRQNLILKDKIGYYYISSLDRLNKKCYPEKFHSSNPYTIQNIKLWIRLNNKEFELISEIYSNNSEHLIFKDKYGYYYNINWNNFQQNKIPNRFHKLNIYTIENIKLWLKLNNKPFELVGDVFIDSKTNLKWKCLKENCGEIFEQTWNCIHQGKGCGFCHGKQVGLSNCLATKNPQLASEWHPTKNGDLTPFDVTCGSSQEVWWQCKDNPKHQWKIGIVVRNKGNNCPYCACKLPSEEYNLLVINPDLCDEWDYNKNNKSPQEYCPNSHDYVWWKCKECNHEWNISIAHRNNGTGCPECNKSKGEKECKRILLTKGLIEINQEDYNILSDLDNNKHIYFIPQKEFNSLLGIGGKNLSYDFYLPKYNLLIEYQGEQHERYIKGFHKSKKDFEKQLEHDRRKREFTQEHNIKLLEIWYYDFNKIEEILTEYLN